MRGNSFGNLFSITTFGESHGSGLGVVIDGMPANIKIQPQELQRFVDLRKPGQADITTSRKEQDQIEILSGVFEERTLGTPISVLVRNTAQRSEDYDKLKNEYRPGHADKTTIEKYGIRDHRGGGRASGRETVARVIAGYFASLVVPNIKIETNITQLAHFKSDRINPFDGEVRNFLIQCKEKGESAGGKVKVIITNCPVGLGEPVFDKLKADLSKAMLSIGACQGILFGLGHDFAHSLGTTISQDIKNFGGIEGGISNGHPIEFELIFKAPSTVGEKAQEGRHDPCILPRVLPVIKSMAFIVLADHYLRQQTINLS